MEARDICSSATFQKSGFEMIRQLLDLPTCELATQYAKFSMARGFSPEEDSGQVPGAHSAYADPFMETLLLICKPRIELVSGLNLFPTYSYFRIYRTGDALARHFDRPACEVSVTLCLGFDFKNGSDKANNHWPIFMGTVQKKASSAGVAIQSDPGDAVIYRGCDVEHWREPMNFEQGSYQVQAFLHYVDANGPFARLCKFDGRPALGLPETTRDKILLKRARDLVPEHHKVVS